MTEMLPEAREVLDLAGAYQRAFDDMVPTVMPRKLGAAYDTWLADAKNVDYEPTFSEKLRGAVEWAEQNPEDFESMVISLDDAIEYVNVSEQELSIHEASMFPNLTQYWSVRDDAVELPTIMGVEEDVRVHNQHMVLRSVVTAARKLRYGETTKPDDADPYTYHIGIKTPRGMAAASLVDLYVIYAQTLGVVPPQAMQGDLLANALTEAVYLTRNDDHNVLLDALSDPVDQWIFGYPAFSKMFQLATTAKFPKKVSLVDTLRTEDSTVITDTFIPTEAESGFTAKQLMISGMTPEITTDDHTMRTFYISEVPGGGVIFLNGRRLTVHKHNYFVIPPGTTYSFEGAITLIQHDFPQ